MIKFVCATCGERLSVPDGHGGRKGVCPSCQAINRIPLKGYAQTQPNVPVVAKLAQATAPAAAPATLSPIPGPGAAPAMAIEETPDADPSAGRPPQLASQTIALTPEPMQAAAPAAVVPLATAPAPARSTPDADDSSRATVSAAKTDGYEMPAARSASRARTHAERTLPKPVKIVLLVIAALAIVGAIWLALYLALRWAAPMT